MAGESKTTGIHDITATLVDSFRDEERRREIGAVLDQDDTTMDNLIKAAAAHLIVDAFHVDYPGETTSEKARNLYVELKHLVKTTINEEIAIQERVMAYTMALHDLLLHTPAIKQPVKKRALFSTFEDDLIETFRTVPEYYFFDFLESVVRVERLVARDRARLGRHAKAPREGDAFSFNRFRYDMIGYLDITRLADLEVLYQPIRKLARDAFLQNVDLLPVSPRGIDAFEKSSALKMQVLAAFKDAMKAGHGFDDVEKAVREMIYTQLSAQAAKSPNDVVYFLQNLLGIGFDGLMALLKRNGIEDISLFASALSIDYGTIEYRFNEKGIERKDVEQLLKYEGNMTSFVQLSLDDHKREQRRRGVPEAMLAKIELSRLVEDHMADIDTPALDFVARDLNVSVDDLVELVMLETGVKDIIKDYSLKSMMQLVMLLKMQAFIDSIAREVFLALLVRLTRQVARIVEFFTLLDQVKVDISASIERMRKQRDMKPRELVEQQDVLVAKIMQLQDNVAYILDKRDPYEINAFILGKLLGSTFEEALAEIKTGNSPVYFDDVEHPIVLEEVDVVSTISALDLLFRAQARSRAG